MTPQQAAVMAHMTEHGSITVMEGVRALDMVDVRKRISELRRLGVDIVDINEPNADGRGQHKRYFLKGENNA